MFLICAPIMQFSAKEVNTNLLNTSESLMVITSKTTWCKLNLKPITPSQIK